MRRPTVDTRLPGHDSVALRVNRDHGDNERGVVAASYLALDLIDSGTSGKLVSIHSGRYGSVPMEAIIGTKKVVDVDKYYNKERLRPVYETFLDQSIFAIASEG